ncbi:MAG TPA: helix-turn-helix domain-containing protein, partial [Thermoanaerobaculia bacterium]|nr:helix-turn-helix domain-containing protein [Thermoanaerobaculia bacterium]
TDLIDVDFRLIAATNRNLEREVQAGRFRSDLYFRLKVVTLEIPALRERPDDLPLLVRHYLDLFADEHGRPKRELSLAAIKALQQAPWPGNIRELKNVLENLVLFGDSPRIEVDDLPAEVLRPAASAAARPDVSPVASVRPMAEIERDAIFAALRQTHGRRGEAARLLDIGLRTLQRKLKEYRAEGDAREFGDEDEKREEA